MISHRKISRLARNSCIIRAKVAREHGRVQMEQNFVRAGEMVDMEDALLLEIYDKLRPNRSTSKNY